ncbi:MAG: GNAT family N-acetyltransferase [Clostridia bacterium]|nr:GNAT family N-acetyltransferase [Clostridia bacterium]
MKYFKKLEGEKNYLSPMNAEDAEMYVKWLNDFKTTDGVGHSKNLINIESEREWIEDSLKKGNFNFAIVKLENDELIGNCGIDSIDYTDRHATLGIFIGEEENRSKGYGAEALKLLLDYGFNYLNMHNIMLQVKSFNERAIACYKKVGFKEFGRRRESYFLNGKYYDDVSMDILEDEFKSDYIKNKNV